jgi:hypothetical protein
MSSSGRKTHRRHRATLAAVVLLALAALTLSACGSDSGTDQSSTSASAPALTQQEFVAKANSLCAKSTKVREQRLQQANSWVKEGEEVSPGLRKKIIVFMVAEPTEELSEQIKALGTVKGGSPALAGFGDTLADAAASARSNPSVVISGAVFNKPDQVAEKAALTSCVL